MSCQSDAAMIVEIFWEKCWKSFRAEVAGTVKDDKHTVWTMATTNISIEMYYLTHERPKRKGST